MHATHTLRHLHDHAHHDPSWASHVSPEHEVAHHHLRKVDEKEGAYIKRRAYQSLDTNDCLFFQD